MRLGVNIDHVASLRQARGVDYPDPVAAALLAVEAGADGITVHLREDRRHIQDQDVIQLQKKLEKLKVPFNLEMAAMDDMIRIAESVRPTYCCLVPEKREEMTTEGGLNVMAEKAHLTSVCQRLGQSGISVSLFIEPNYKQVDAAVVCGAELVEIHTGAYAHIHDDYERKASLDVVKEIVVYAKEQGLQVNAGHGLTIHNVQAIAAIPGIYELNIGHSIIARAVFVGLKEAVQEMKILMDAAQ